MAGDASRRDRDIRKHRRVASDIGGIEECRVTGGAYFMELFELLAGEQVRRRDRVVGTEKEAERNTRPLQGSRRIAEEQRREGTGGNVWLAPFLTEFQACLGPGSDDVRRPQLARRVVFAGEDAK